MKAICKMVPSARMMILGWIGENLENCENLRIHGKLLKGDKMVFGDIV